MQFLSTVLHEKKALAKAAGKTACKNTARPVTREVEKGSQVAVAPLIVPAEAIVENRD